MALRLLRLTPTISQKACHARHFSSMRGSLYIAQDVTTRSSVVDNHHSHSSSTHRYTSSNCMLKSSCRSFSSKSNSEEENKNATTDNTQTHEQSDYIPEGDEPLLIYEGPMASPALTLKRVSLTSAVIALVGLPGATLFMDGSVPAAGKLAVIATAGLTAVGSTALLGYCFSPYVHTLERLPKGYTNGTTDTDHATTAMMNGDTNLVRIITRDILARRVETIFNPQTDVSSPPGSNSRPFCNFMVRAGEQLMPMYVHPELVHDYKLRVMLVGEEPQQDGAEERNKQKVDDDEFL